MTNLSIALFLITLLGFTFFPFICTAEETAEPPLIPLEILFGNPEKVEPKISPNGKILAYVAPCDNVLNIWVKTVGLDDDRVVTKDKKRGIRTYFWDYDNKHIMYLQDKDGNENWNLYRVNIETCEVSSLTPYPDVQVRLISRDENFPGELLIGMNKENPEIHDVYHLDLSTGELVMVAKNPGNVTEWIADSEFKIRGSMASTEDGNFELLTRKDENSDWKKLLTWTTEDCEVSGPQGFSKDGKYIYLKDSRNANTCRLIKMDIDTGDAEIIAEDPQYDIHEVVINPRSYEIQALSFCKDRVEWLVLDEELKDDFLSMTELDRGELFICNRDISDNIWIVAFTRDKGPTSTWAFDRRTKEGAFLFYSRPDLTSYTLAEMEPISFTSRDGLTIHGYITYPPGKEKKNLPLVVKVHGGPWARDTWGYHGEVQWLANRGYACLQINFRGSTGYGKDFVNAGDREWGAKMHDDLVDGVSLLVEEGIADPERIAIMGHSYGGYAALVGATFTPDLFCCAIDVCGPSNLITLIETVPPYWEILKANLINRVGDPETEEEFLKSRSPLFKVDEIKIPVLVVQGVNDPRVKQAEAEQIVEAMEKGGLDYEYLLFPDEGHVIVRPENKLKFYETAEKFLAKHLGGRYEE